MEKHNYGCLIEQDEIYDVVHYDEYDFDFIRKSDNFNSIDICPKNDYLKCKMLDGSDILIYARNKFHVSGKMWHFSPGLYIRGGINEDNLKGIEFTGGILSNLFIPNSIETRHSEGGTVLNYKDDSIVYTVQIGQKEIEIRVASQISESLGVSGIDIKNNNVALDVIFKDGLKLDDIRTVIQAVNEMCQFMTSRKNIKFDSMKVLECYGIEDESSTLPGADIFYKSSYTCFTEKDWIQSLSFSDLGEALPKLFRAMYLKGKEKTDYFTLDYLAKDDNEDIWFDERRIKSICTAVESEAERQGFVAETNDEFEELKKKTKSLINEYKTKEWMSDRTYNLLASNIRNWDFSAYDKYIRLFRKYEEYIVLSEVYRGSAVAFEDAIGKIISYRNSSTHGTYKQVTAELAETAYSLMLLVYCSRLDYLGISKDILWEKIRNRAFA